MKLRRVYRAYKVELKPNNKQKTLLLKSCGTARFAYNWGLAERIRFYEEEKKSTTAIDQHRELCKLKKTDFYWMYEVSKQAPQNALRDLDKAFKNFFRGLKKGQNIGFPKFKKRGVKDSFRIDGANICITNSTIKIPRVGTIRLKEKGYIPFDGVKFLNATICKDVDRWFVSVAVEYKQDVIDKSIEEVIGIDLGIKELATCSNDEVYHNPKTLYRYEKKLKREQKKLSRKKKGGKNRAKQIIKVAKVHRKIRNVRLDYIHKMTSSITKAKCRTIILEDLNVKGMMKNHHFAKSIADSSFHEIKRQFEYKTQFYGGELFIIDRWFPSSKMCSNCGIIKEDLKLSDRIYKCDCGIELDRDLNAAINIKNYYITVSSTGSYACGENVRPDLSGSLGEARIKQESSC